MAKGGKFPTKVKSESESKAQPHMLHGPKVPANVKKGFASEKGSSHSSAWNMHKKFNF